MAINSNRKGKAPRNGFFHILQDTGMTPAGGGNTAVLIDLQM